MGKAANYRKQQKEKAEQKPDLTAEIELPSGAVFTMRRPPLQVWMALGKVPQSFMKAMMGAQASGGEQPKMTPAETLDTIKFVGDAILYAVVDPVFKNGAGPNDDALDPSEIDPADFEFLTTFIMKNCPGIPVETEGGEISTDALNTFRQKRPGGGIESHSGDGGEVRQEAFAVAANS